MGARAQGMGYVSACSADLWAISNNPGGLTAVKITAASFSCHAVPAAPFFNRAAAVVALPVWKGVAGASLFRAGDALYNEQMLSAAFANTFGLASLGVKANWIQYHAEGYGTHSVFTLSFGGIASITPALSVGAHIANINQPQIDVLTGERVPTMLLAGMALKPSDKVTVAAEVEKDLDRNATFKAGCEYKPLKKITFRTGFNLHPEMMFFGTGFKPGKFAFDYALQHNRMTGLSHQATVTCHVRNP